MGAEVVVGILPVPEDGVHGGGRGLGAGDCIEFLPVGASGALHVRVELGGIWVEARRGGCRGRGGPVRTRL